jgi:poly(3-hydroxybutyrate) depolymerase
VSDVVVVGGGSAGAALAGRLSEDAARSPEAVAVVSGAWSAVLVRMNAPASARLEMRGPRPRGEADAPVPRRLWGESRPTTLPAARGRSRPR